MGLFCICSFKAVIYSKNQANGRRGSIYLYNSMFLDSDI